MPKQLVVKTLDNGEQVVVGFERIQSAEEIRQLRRAFGKRVEKRRKLRKANKRKRR
jgi:hypothetical protein